MTRCSRGCDIAIFVLALWRLAATAAEDDTAAPKSRKFAVVAYLPDWRYESTNWDEISQVATHLILHGLQPSKDGHIDGIDRLPHGRMLDEAKAALKAAEAQLEATQNSCKEAGKAVTAADKHLRHIWADMMHACDAQDKLASDVQHFKENVWGAFNQLKEKEPEPEPVEEPEPAEAEAAPEAAPEEAAPVAEVAAPVRSVSAASVATASVTAAPVRAASTASVAAPVRGASTASLGTASVGTASVASLPVREASAASMEY